MDQRFLTVYHQHKDLVYNLCLHYVHRPEDAEEITQDVFIKAHQKLNTFKENSTIKTWLYRITINTCLDFLKAQSRQKRFGFLTGLLDSETQRERPELTHHLHPGIQMEHREGLSEILAWIDELPPTQKTAIVLMKIEGFSQK
jgi:RNA polymerase sigma factor (sigma-70 family)